MQKRVRAIIIKDGKVLTIKRTKPDAMFWVFPGGGVEEGETNEKSLIRECKEELGVDVRVCDLFCEKDSKDRKIFGQREYFYFCDIKDGELGTGMGPEFQENSAYIGKFDIEWVVISKLENIDLRPSEIKNLICKKYL